MTHTEQQPENVLHHSHDHVWQNAPGIPAAGDGQREGHWEDIPPPIKNIGQAQHPHYIDRPHNLPPPPAFPAVPYDLGVHDGVALPVENVAIEDQARHLHNVDEEAHHNGNLPVPAYPAVPYDLGINNYARPIQDVQARAQVIGPAPEIQGNGIFPYAPQRAEAGPYPAFPGNWPYQAPPGARQAESLRRLASRYLHHPNSQVDTVRMERDPAGRPKVVIILDMDDFL